MKYHASNHMSGKKLSSTPKTRQKKGGAGRPLEHQYLKHKSMQMLPNPKTKAIYQL